MRREKAIRELKERESPEVSKVNIVNQKSEVIKEKSLLISQ